MKEIITVLIGLIMMAMVFTILARASVLEYQNECLVERPIVSISGNIHHSSGFFGPGSNIYYLYCKGKTRKDQEECEVKIAVTKSEYERQMYKTNR
jgi:hypothetical protein